MNQVRNDEDGEAARVVDEFAELEKELNVHNRDGRPGFPVKEGAFKGWRAFGAHPFSPDEKKNVIREFLDSEVGLLGIFLAILLGIYFTFAVVLTILHPVMWVVGILAFIFSSFNNLMIRFGWFKLAKCHGKYILWDGKNVFALPLKYGKNLIFTSKDIATITVEYGHSETVRVRNRNKGNANINFRVGLFSSMSDDTADHVDIDKQEFVKILASATGLEPIMKHIYRGS